MKTAISKSKEQRAKSQESGVKKRFQTHDSRLSTIDFSLYLITDRKLFTDNFSLFTAVEEALKGGKKIIQIAADYQLNYNYLIDLVSKEKRMRSNTVLP